MSDKQTFLIGEELARLLQAYDAAGRNPEDQLVVEAYHEIRERICKEVTDLQEEIRHEHELPEGMPHGTMNFGAGPVSMGLKVPDFLRNQENLREERHGINGCFNMAAYALRYLSKNLRPSGGQDKFNAEHLLQIADEIEKSIERSATFFNEAHKASDKLFEEAGISKERDKEAEELVRDFEQAVIALQTHCDAHSDKWNAVRSKRAQTRKALLEHLKELHYTFDLRWEADMRAIKQWREANPGNEDVFPDHTDLCVWLMGQMKGLENLMLAAGKEIKSLEAARAGDQQRLSHYEAHIEKLTAPEPPDDELIAKYVQAYARAVEYSSRALTDPDAQKSRNNEANELRDRLRARMNELRYNVQAQVEGRAEDIKSMSKQRDSWRQDALTAEANWHAACDDINTLQTALRTILAWELPATGKFHSNGEPMSYSYCWGANGERDYMRNVAQRALNKVGTQVHHEYAGTKAELLNTQAMLIEALAFINYTVGTWGSDVLQANVILRRNKLSVYPVVSGKLARQHAQKLNERLLAQRTGDIAGKMEGKDMSQNPKNPEPVTEIDVAHILRRYVTVLCGREGGPDVLREMLWDSGIFHENPFTKEEEEYLIREVYPVAYKEAFRGTERGFKEWWDQE